jgi:transcriptional regulator with XRE-family HTH domain
MTVGQRIKEARKIAKLTQRELAEKAGTATGTIQQYELGKRQPRLQQLRQIAQVLDADVVYLISGQTSAEVEQGILAQAEAEAKYYVKGRFAEAETWKSRKDEIGEDLAKLNDDGQIEAVKRVKELTRLDEYRRGTELSPLSAGIKVYGEGPTGSFLPVSQPPSAPPQSPLAPQEGTSTTPPPEGAEGPQEGE